MDIIARDRDGSRMFEYIIYDYNESTGGFKGFTVLNEDFAEPPGETVVVASHRSSIIEKKYFDIEYIK